LSIRLIDEIDGELHHHGNHLSLARYDPEGIIVRAGFSKWYGAGGWRLGTFSFTAGLSWLLEETAVATLPGTSFGCAPDSPRLRVAKVDFDGTEALKASGEAPDATELPLEFLEQHGRPIVETIEPVREWIA